VVISLPTIFSFPARQAGSYQTAVNLKGMENLSVKNLKGDIE
jgi:hypothetical protein